jgi:uncharacterized protein (TIGR02271 family)
VVDKDGLRGSADPHALSDDSAPHVLIRLEDGQTMLTRKALLQAQPDGSYYLPLSFAELQAAAEHHDEIVVPVVEEEVRVAKRSVESGRVRLTKTVDEREVLIDQPLLEEHVEVNRIAVNQMVDAPPPIRYEGDTMIIPVLEEVVVVDIKLMVREEIHVIRTRQEVHQPQSVMLRREEVAVERDPENGSA